MTDLLAVERRVNASCSHLLVVCFAFVLSLLPHINMVAGEIKLKLSQKTSVLVVNFEVLMGTENVG